MGSSTTWIHSLKALLISTGFVSIAMAMKFSVPLMVNFAVYEVPAIWSALLSWLKPPYLYVVINGIIITIAASSRFYYKLDDDHHSEPLVRENSPLPSDLPSELPSVSNQLTLASTHFYHKLEDDHQFEPLVRENAPRPSDLPSELPPVSNQPVMINGSEVAGNEDEDESEFIISMSSWTPPQRINSLENQTKYVLPLTEKPLVSSRFSHRKPAKASPEGGRALRVAKPKRPQETLGSTWKTITDGRHMPLTRHLKKSETWENHGRYIHVSSPESSSSPQVVKKSETFNDRTNYNNPPASSVSSSPGSGKLKKETSLSQDELNRRVEAFIKKFNEEMRLQRQESLNHFESVHGDD